MNREIGRIMDLAAMLKERELAKLSAIARQRDLCQKAVDDCRTVLARTLLQSAPDAAHVSGMAEPWLHATRVRLHRLTAELAQCAAEAEEQGVRARQAFGRAEALSKLEKSRPGKG